MVNNAGIAIEANYVQPIHSFQEDHLLDKALDVNVKGVFYGIRAASAQMIKQAPFDESGDRGWIINTASIFGLVGCPNAGCYVASKHAVVGLTRSAALENATHRIHVNAICPGFLNTSLTRPAQENRPESIQQAAMMHPWGGGGIGSPKDVSGVAVFLASEDARWMTGAAVTTDGGYTAM
jgi:NAD(P)-dependent dehydrogenase (short-subunit alcohol dehydrogenase family)